jgi:hypothetical protein
VQSYALATDQLGLQLLLGDEHVFSCYNTRWACCCCCWQGSLGRTRLQPAGR